MSTAFPADGQDGAADTFEGDQRQAASRAATDREFSRLALPHLAAVARVARALAMNESDADDLVQETFLRAYKHWHTFDRTADCRRWLSTICRNAFLEQRKRRGAMPQWTMWNWSRWRLPVPQHREGKRSGWDVRPARSRAGDLQRDQRARPTFRDVVALVDVEGFSYEQVAEALSIPIGTVRSRLYRARRALQESLLAFAIDAGFTTSVE